MGNTLPELHNSEEAQLIEPERARAHWSLRHGPRVMIAGVFLLCLFFGGRVTQLLALLKLSVFSAAVLLARDLRREKFQLSFSSLGLKILFLGTSLLIITLFQVLPLPLQLLKMISPNTAELYRQAGATWGAISIHPRETLAEAVWLGAVLLLGAWAAFFPYKEADVSLQVRQRRRRTRNRRLSKARKSDELTAFLQAGVVLLGAFLSLIALIHWGLRSEALFGIFYYPGQGPEQSRAHWPFISPNHLSTLLGMAALLGFAHVLRLIELRRMRGPETGSGNQALRILRNPQELGVLLPYVLAVLTIVLANILTLSRAGNALMFMGLGAVWLTALKNFPARSVRTAERGKAASAFRRRVSGVIHYSVVLGGLLLFISTLLGGTGRQLASSRLEYGLAAGIDENRLLLADATLKVFSRYPLLGSGLGTWHLAATREIPRELAGWELDFAHNEYLQLLAETGFAGGVIAILILYLLIQSGFRTWRRRLRPTERVEFAGCAAALSLPLLHALVDFPFHLPATATVALIVLVIYLRLIERARRNDVQG